MGIFDFIGRRAREKFALEQEFLREKHEQKLDLERRKKEIDLITAEKRAELERMRLEYQIKEQQIRIREDFDEDYDESDEDSAEMKLLAPLLTNFLNNNQKPAEINSIRTEHTQTQNSSNSGAVSDLELLEIWDKTPEKYKIAARMMTDEQIKEVIKKQLPLADNDTLTRALKIIRGGSTKQNN